MRTSISPLFRRRAMPRACSARRPKRRTSGSSRQPAMRLAIARPEAPPWAASIVAASSARSISTTSRPRSPRKRSRYSANGRQALARLDARRLLFLVDRRFDLVAEVGDARQPEDRRVALHGVDQAPLEPDVAAAFAQRRDLLAGLAVELGEPLAVAHQALEQRHHLALLALEALALALGGDVAGDEQHLVELVAGEDRRPLEVELLSADAAGLGELVERDLDGQDVVGDLAPADAERAAGDRVAGLEVSGEVAIGGRLAQPARDDRRALVGHAAGDVERDQPLLHVIEDDAHVAVAPVELGGARAHDLLQADDVVEEAARDVAA